MQDKSFQRNSEEELLCFKEVYLGIFYAFSMNGAKIKDENDNVINSKYRVIDALKKCNLVAEWNNEDYYAKSFEYAQGFFLDNKLPSHLIRLKLNSSCLLDFRPEELNLDVKDIFLKRTDPASRYLKELLPENAWSDRGQLAIALNDLINGQLIIDNDRFLELAGYTTEARRIVDDRYNNNTCAINRHFLEEAIPGLATKHSGPSEYKEKETLDLSTLSISCSQDPSSTKPVFIPIDVYLSIFPDDDIGILFFNIKFGPSNRLAAYCAGNNKLTTDYLIFLIHSLFEDRFKVNAIIPSCLKKLDMKDGKHKMDEIAYKYVELVLSAFDIKNINKLSNDQFVKKRILEIRDSGDGQNLGNAEDFLKKYPKQTYGLMMGDEGWRFVPKKFSISRILERWGSRDFLSVLISSDGAILLNFRNTNHHECYVNTQKKLRMSFQNPVEYYFNFNFDISGMEHGIFIYLERAVLTRLVLNQQKDKLNREIEGFSRGIKSKKILKFLDGGAQKEIERISKMMNEFDVNLNRIYSENKLWEMGEMYKNISNSMKLGEDINDIKIRLGDFFNRSYSIKNNQFMSNLNNWGLLTALIGTSLGISLAIVGAILTIIGLYLSGAQVYLSKENLTHMVSSNFNVTLHTWIRPLFT